ncbi:hypothetical protein K435DRAFT_391867 [Dendrothele bispora CBS 962.96]|uniref:Uncharacterized protein n=1 Tax=Dendrothele bispora (strain CBS 962.96) TaxID=1314807 RepID=A0A4S8L910_DENBC|nr:hypothetical protein K435DRAFT_391867 [Dendrothele bispora CBS 962.96]
MVILPSLRSSHLQHWTASSWRLATETAFDGKSSFKNSLKTLQELSGNEIDRFLWLRARQSIISCRIVVELRK